MFMLHLICAACSLLIISITSQFIEIHVIAMISSCFIFFLGFRQIADSFSLPEKIIKRQVEKEFNQHEKEIKAELEQAKRKREFFEAFETDEEKTQKENTNKELQEYLDMYEKAKSNYQGKHLAEMNSYEKARYYERKIKRLNKFTPILSIMILFTMGFILLFGQYISLLTTSLICGLVVIIFTPIWISYFIIYKKYKKHYEAIQPQPYIQFLRDLGIK